MVVAMAVEIGRFVKTARKSLWLQVVRVLLCSEL
jgi:hypothetical protein